MNKPVWTILAVGVVITALYALASWHVLNAIKTALAKHEPSTQVIVVPAEVGVTEYPEIGEEVPVTATVASWYGPGFYGRTTANGETYTAQEMTAAHKEWPFGTWVELENPDNGKILAVRINDRGPFIEGRDIDLSEEAAKHLGIINAGVVELKASVLRWGSGN